MSRLSRLVALAIVALLSPRIALAQDPCMQFDPPPPPECWAISVTPDGGLEPTRPANSGTYTATFTIQNLGLNDMYNVSCSGTGGVTCTGTSVTNVWLGGSATVEAYYTAGAPGTGTLYLDVGGTYAFDGGSYSVPIAGSAGVAVTPDGGSAPTRTANTGGHSETFTVQNTGSISDTYTFSCNGVGGATCGTPPGSVTLGAGASTTRVMPYSVGAPGTGTLTLTASGTGVSNPGSFSVPIVSYGVAVTPDGGTSATREANTGGYSETFTVQNTGSASNTYSFSCVGASGVACGTPPSAVTVGAGLSTTVAMPYSVGPAATGTLTLTATGTSASNPGSFNVPIVCTVCFAPSVVSGGLFTKDSRYLLQETADAYESASGRITQLTDARGKVTTYQYGGNLNNAFLIRTTRVHDASGPIDLITEITYDTDGFVASIKDEGGTFRYFTYDLFGRLTQVKNNAGTVSSQTAYAYSRTSANGWTFQASTPNAITTTTFIQQTPTVKSVVSTEHIDGLGRSLQTVVHDGTNYHVTATQYDVMGRVWRTWKPYTRSVAGYDPSFAANATAFYNTYHVTSNAKPYVETSYTPDALARVKQVTPEYIGTTPTAFVLHAYGVEVATKQEYAEVTDEVGKKTRTYTDVFGNQVRNIMGFGAPEATTTQFVYNVLGQRTQVTDPRNLVSTFAVDTRGLLTTRTSPEAGSLNSKYDRAGNVRYTQDANQAAVGQVLFTNYDFAARPLTSGVGAATFATLDPDAPSPPALETTQANWLIVRQYDAKPSTAAFPWSRFSSQITPLTLSNVSGRLAAIAGKSNGAWQITLFSYDADGELATRYTYTEANGGASVLTALNTTISYVRDLRGSLTQRWLTVGTSTFNHWYDYDGRGLLSQVFSSTSSTKPAAPDVTDTFRPGGQAASYQFQGGPAVPITYTIREQTEKIGDPALTTYPFSARYTYNTNATLSEADFYSAGSPAAQKRYRYQFPTYDALNRLKSADFSSWSGSAWTVTAAYDLAGINYDAAGNLTSLQRYRDAGTLIDNLTYGNSATSNRLNSVSDAVGATAETWDAETGAFTYDANGNIATAPAPYSLTAITYNHQNLPLSVTRSGTTTTYRYDDVGQRISKRTGTGNTELYVLEGASNLGVFTVDGAGTSVSWYFNVLAGSRVVGRQTNAGTRTYYHADLLGSTRAVVLSTTGAVVESYDFEPWGLLLAGRTLAGPTKEGFGAKEQDVETGLDYFGARYYMPALGRWGSVDPAASSTPEWSPYVFVNDNPATQTDPDGRQAEIAVAVLQAHPEFTQGVAEGFVEGAKSTWHMITHPLQTAKGVLTMAAAGAGNPEAQLQVAQGLKAAADGLVSEWNSGEGGKGRIVGRVVEGVAEAAVTWGAGEAVSAIKGAARTTVTANRVAGKAGEALTEATLRSEGKLAGKQVMFETSSGERTVADFVTNEGGGRAVVETKTGGGRLTRGQRQLFDDVRNKRPVTPVGGNAKKAGFEPGKPTVLKSCRIDRPC